VTARLDARWLGLAIETALDVREWQIGNGMVIEQHGVQWAKPRQNRFRQGRFAMSARKKSP